MNKIIFCITTFLTLSNSSYAMVGGADISDNWKDCKISFLERPYQKVPAGALETGVCRIGNYTTSLPTLLIGDENIDVNSKEYQAILVDQATRTLNGETTLFFGNDSIEAESFLKKLLN